MSDPREQALTHAAVNVMTEYHYDPHFAGPSEKAVMESRLFLARWDALQNYEINKFRRELISSVEDVPVDHPSGTMKGRVTWDLPPKPEGRAFVKGEEIIIVDGRGNHIPVPMILWCPACGSQHVDREEEHKPECMSLKIGPEPDPSHCNCDRWANPPHRSHLCAGCGHIWRPSDVYTEGVAEIATKGSKDTPAPVRGRVGHLPTAKADCMFVRCPTPGLCKEGCKHVKQLGELTK